MLQICHNSLEKDTLDLVLVCLLEGHSKDTRRILEGLGPIKGPVGILRGSERIGFPHSFYGTPKGII